MKNNKKTKTNKKNLMKFKNNKGILILGSVFLVLIAVFVLRNTLSNPNTGYLRNQTVDGLSFEDTTLEYNEGVTTFTSKVYNESGDEYTLKNITVVLSNGTKTTSLTGYIGESLENEEGKVLKISIDDDLSDSTSLTYKINK